MPNDLDTLMTRVTSETNHKPPLEITATDIDDLIAFHRASRAKRSSSDRGPARSTAEADAMLASIVPTAPAEKLNLKFKL